MICKYVSNKYLMPIIREKIKYQITDNKVHVIALINEKIDLPKMSEEKRAEVIKRLYETVQLTIEHYIEE